MPAGVLNLTIEQGATFKQALLVQAPGGMPMDLAGATARMQLRPSVASDTVLLELTTANGRLTIDAAQGRIDMLVQATETNTLPAAAAVYDLELELSTGEVLRLVRGTVQVVQGVTR